MHQSCSCTLKVMMHHASQNQRLGLNTEFTFSQKHSVLATMQPFASTGQTARSQLGWLYQPPLWLSKESINPCQQTVTYGVYRPWRQCLSPRQLHQTTTHCAEPLSPNQRHKPPAAAATGIPMHVLLRRRPAAAAHVLQRFLLPDPALPQTTGPVLHLFAPAAGCSAPRWGSIAVHKSTARLASLPPSQALVTVGLH